MVLSAMTDHNPKSDSTNPCCDHLKKKYTKVLESRNALRQAVKVLEQKINEFQARNDKACGGKIKTEGKLEDVTDASVSLENETCGFKSQIDTSITQQGCGGDAGDGNGNLGGLLADREKEICRLKELLEVEKGRVDSERKKGAEACKLLDDVKNMVAGKDKEIGRLKGLLEAEKRRADSEGKKAAEGCKLLGEEKNKDAEREKEISRLKGLLDVEKRRADSEGKKAAKFCKLLEEEKKKAAEKGESSRIKVEKAEKYRIQIAQLEKQVNETKVKLASEISTFKELTKKFEAEKRKILAEKRNAESGMAKANEMLEAEKQKVVEEKRRADAEMVKLEEQKVLVEDNWNKFMKEKCLVDQMSQQLKEDRQMIEDLKRKIDELSSLRKPVEMAADSKVKAESTEVKLLKNKLKLEKLRAKHTREKYESEASRYSLLRHEFGRLKIDFIQFLHRLDILDASFSPVAGSKHDQTKIKVWDYLCYGQVVMNFWLVVP